MLYREAHADDVELNQKAKLLIMEQKKHLSMNEEILIACYNPPKIRWKTRSKLLTKKYR